MTSESEPTQDKPITPDSGGKAKSQGQQSNPDMPIVPGVPTTPPTKPHCEITCKTEKDFWEHVKTGAEILGADLNFRSAPNFGDRSSCDLHGLHY